MAEQPTLTLDDIEDLLASPPAGEAARRQAEARILAMVTLLAGRYRATWAARFEQAKPLLVAYVAAALDRRAAKSNPMAESETAGPFTVRWASETSNGTWFLAAELADLDLIFGRGGTRTVRTPAPDEIRALNRLRMSEIPEETAVSGIEYGADWCECDV